MSSTSTPSPTYSGAFPPPPGYTANVENPHTHLHTINIAGMATCNFAIVVAYVLRCLGKRVVRSPWIAEDWSCLLAWVLAILYIAMCYMMGYHGEGYHAWEVTPENYEQVMKWLYISSIVWIPASFFAKTTLLLLTARVFAVYERVALAIHVYIWLLLVAYTPVQFVKIFICWPISSYWDRSVHGRCLDQPKVFLTDTAMAAVTDLIIMMIPIPILWQVRMTLRKKLKILAMLSAGGGAVGVACYREYRIYVFQWSTDVTGDFVVMNLCGTIEITIGIVCACLPAINLMLEKQHAARMSQNRPRTRFLSSIVAWKSSLSGSILKSTHFTHTHREDINTNGVGHSPWSVDQEIGLQEICNSGKRSATGKADDIGVTQLIAGPCIRLNSNDGREEGWLRSGDGESGCNGADAASGTSRPMAYAGGVTLQQLRQDPRDILVPDRIWDGKRRSHEGPAPGDMPRASRPKLPPRSISTPLSSEASTSFRGVPPSSAADSTKRPGDSVPCHSETGGSRCVGESWPRDRLTAANAGPVPDDKCW